MLENLGVKYEIKPFVAEEDATNAYYEPKRSASIYCGDVKLGDLGEIKNKVLREFKLTQARPLSNLIFEAISHAEGATHKDFRVSQYPFVSRDVTLSVSLDTEYASLEQQIRAILEKADYIYKLECTSIYRPEGADTKNISFHLDFADPSKTLEKGEINAIMAKVEQVK